MVWASGQELYGSRYIIDRQLGYGGIGITYLAKNRNGQRVVIKTLKDELLSHPQFAWFRDKFRDEALLLSLCRHPNIVQIENAFSEGQLPCISMEYVEGEDLAKRVANLGVMSESEALRYIRQIGEALQALHEKGLLHRDIKPANIMVRAGLSEAVLIDFGLARGFIPDVTQPNTRGYSGGFYPPEQYVESARLGEYTDVYALAATLYYLLTKTAPTSAPERALKTRLQAPKEINSSISAGVNKAIMKGMALEAKYRPQSVRDWLRLLPATPAGSSNIAPTVPNPPSVQRMPAFASPPPVQLVSAAGADYGKLLDLLAAGKWKEADEETRIVMLKAAGREKEGWLEIKDIETFPCPDLRILDEIWVQYSNGRFGFSVQKRIYQSLGVPREYDRKIWHSFGKRVGWRVKDKWLDYNELTFNINAPVGHLSVCGLAVGGFGVWSWCAALFSRVETCKL